MEEINVLMFEGLEGMTTEFRGIEIAGITTGSVIAATAIIAGVAEVAGPLALAVFSYGLAIATVFHLGLDALAVVSIMATVSKVLLTINTFAPYVAGVEVFLALIGVIAGAVWVVVDYFVHREERAAPYDIEQVEEWIWLTGPPNRSEFIYPDDYTHDLRFDEYATLDKTRHLYPRTTPHYYAIKGMKDDEMEGGKNHSFNASEYDKIVNDKRMFDYIFHIKKEAFQKATGLGNRFTYPPRLNYIGDYAFNMSDIESFDFTQGNDVSVIGAGAFQGTKLPAIDLSGHFALASLGMRCFAHNEKLHTLKLPGSIVGMGCLVVYETPNLHTIELGWRTKQQLDLIKKNFKEESNPFSIKEREDAHNPYAKVEAAMLVPFADKELVIPFGSFEQYYRHNRNCTYLGGNFLIKENYTVLQAVENGDGLHLTKDEVLKAAIDNMKYESPKGLDKDDEKKARAAFDRTKKEMENEYADPDNRDKNSGILYAVNVFDKKAIIIENEFIKKSSVLTIKTDKMNFNGEEYPVEYSKLPPNIKSVVVDMEHVSDSLFGRLTGYSPVTFSSDSEGVIKADTGAFSPPPSITFTDKVKTIDRGIFNKKDTIDVYFDWHTSTSRTLVDDEAFSENVRLHVRNYDGKPEDFNYFKFNSGHFKGGRIMPLSGMTPEELSQRTLDDGITYEFVRPDTARIARLGESVSLSLSEKRDIADRYFSVPGFGRLDFLRGSRRIRTVKLAADITSLPDRTFEGCDSLERTEGEDHLVSIGDYAFRNCRSFKSLTVADSAKRIGRGAFEGCTGLTSIQLLSDSPETVSVGEGAFAKVPASCRVHIPGYSEDNYGWMSSEPSHSWQGLLIAPNYYPIEVRVNDLRGGNVSGYEDAGGYAYASKAPLTAHPADGYHFETWKNTTSDERVSSEDCYAITVSTDTKVRALFLPSIYRVSLLAENGRVKSGDGTYGYRARATIEAAASRPGYHFVEWTNQWGDRVSDANPYSFAVTGDELFWAHFARTKGWTVGDDDNMSDAEATDALSVQYPDVLPFQADFAVNSHTVDLFAVNGQITKPDSGAAEATHVLPLQADADGGYHFVKWTTAAGDSLSAENPYALTVESDTAVRAHFAANLYPVRVSAANGRIKAGGGSYFYHTQARIEAEGDAGYRFVKWTDAGGKGVSGQNPCTFIVTGEAELRAVFEKAGATHALPVLLPEAEAGVYYADGVLHLVNLEGYSISVSTMKGERVLQFMTGGDDEHYPAVLPAGVYVLNGAKWKEKYVVKKFVVK
ncbi:hypothetical protein Barb6XT_00180 [Bacteroidales bacterium Barb6XT]|nr:hypothetical protein Barb6XT_00180 [Bacteroidales bacterium Barb6XT]